MSCSCLVLFCLQACLLHIFVLRSVVVSFCFTLFSHKLCGTHAYVLVELPCLALFCLA